MQNLRTSFGHNHRRRTNRRSGISLFEVVLALGIFVGAIAALSQLSSNGMTAAVKSRLQTQAIMRCESKLAEITSAVEPLVDVNGQPFEDDENWKWSLQTAPGPHADLMLITVIVEYQAPGSEGSLATTEFEISRLIRDPAVFEVSTEDSSSSTTGGTP